MKKQQVTNDPQKRSKPNNDQDNDAGYSQPNELEENNGIRNEITDTNDPLERASTLFEVDV